MQMHPLFSLDILDAYLGALPNSFTNYSCCILYAGRYFIVIDDIWDTEAWEIIRCALVDNNCASRIVTTTRILDVATKTGDIYKLKPLSQHLSEELFYTRLFGGKDKCPLKSKNF